MAVALPPALEQLDLFSCKLTDEDIEQIARCQSVKELSLIGNREVTDQSIDALLSMPSLERAIVGATGFSDKGEQRLREALHERKSGR